MQLLILLEKTRRETLTEQLTDQLRQAILKKRILQGARLPSSRNLAEQLGIARNTVVRAYETLIVEGYAEARPASGIFVAAEMALPLEMPPSPGAEKDAQQAISQAPIIVDQQLKRLVGNRDRRVIVDFLPDQTSAAVFPLKMWRRLIQNHLSHGAAVSLSTSSDAAGLAELRAAIAQYLGSANGIVVDPAQVIITSGRIESLNLIARMFLSYDARVVMEDPGYLGAYLAFKSAGAKIREYLVDEDGLAVDNLPERLTSLAYLTPSHQYPTGTVLSAARRHSLIAWARRNRCIIVEDGYGGEFHDDGTQLQPLAAAAPDTTVHLGDFTTSLGDGVRIGYVLVPPRYADQARLTKASLSNGSPWLEQVALAEMISSGKYASHVLRARAHYRSCRNTLVSALRRHFGDVVLGGANAGLQLFWQLPPGVPEARIFENQARRARVGAYSLDSASVHVTESNDLRRRGILLGFGALSERLIEKGIARLSDAVDDALDDHLTKVDELLVDLPPMRRPIPMPKIRGAPVPAKNHGSAPRRSVEAWSKQPRTSHIETGSPMPLLKGIYQYPIKGLSGQPLSNVTLEVGKHFPNDRKFALARPGVPLQTDNPRWAKKGLFIMLMLEEALAKVQTHLDSTTMQFDIRKGNELALSVNLNDPEGRAAVEQFFHELVPTLPAPPTLVQSSDGHFMDKPDNVISLINLATIRNLEKQWGTEIDPLRFRANLYVDTGHPWEEFDWVNSEIKLGDAVFQVNRKNGRCGATNVNPSSGVRDMDIPASLRASFGHKDLGVYLMVAKGGAIAINDKLTRPHSSPIAPSARPMVSVEAERRFICRGCYFIYSEEEGLPAIGIPPGTAYKDLPEDYRCPDCGTDRGKLRPYVAPNEPKREQAV